MSSNKLVNAAKILANRHADRCGVDREDNWKIYGDDFIEDAKAGLSEFILHAEQQEVRYSELLRAYHCACASLSKSEPVAWMDDYGNTFPLGSNKGAGGWMDQHKREWRPLYAHPFRTEQDVQTILTVARIGQIGEMTDIEATVRRILGVQAP